MEIGEELTAVRGLVQVLLKAKKTFRMYPRNNPIYVKTLEEVSGKFDNFFNYKDELRLLMGRNDILYHSESVYHSTEMHDNLALTFFKDGLRELSFKKGVSLEEVEEFMRIVSQDFEREIVEDDIVTLLWEKDFENIKYVVEDTFIDEEAYEEHVINELKQKSSPPDLRSIYESFAEDKDDGTGDVVILPLTDGDFKAIFDLFDLDARGRGLKLLNMLIDIFADPEESEPDLLAGFITRAIEFFMKRGDVHAVTEAVARLKNVIDRGGLEKEAGGPAARTITFINSEKLVALVGEILDGGLEIEKHTFIRFVGLLDTRAIAPFIKTLGKLKTIYARRLFIEGLVHLGATDISLLLDNLADPRWYLVRNMAHVLGKIGDNRAVSHLLKTLAHGDVRVKKEVIQALGAFGGDKVLAALQECLGDNNPRVRKAALGALRNMGSGEAKKIIMELISKNNFADRDFNERKECFETLAAWKDSEVREFLSRIVKKKSFLRKAKHNENRACAAYCLGLTGSRDALPVLNKFKVSSNRPLREFSLAALKRLEDVK